MDLKIYYQQAFLAILSIVEESYALTRSFISIHDGSRPEKTCHLERNNVNLNGC